MRTGPGVIVSIDGLSGVGKSTVSTLLASALPAERITVPPAELRGVSEWFARNADRHPQVAGAFFVSSLGAALVRASDLRTGGLSSVLDRYRWSTVGPLAALGANLDDMLALLPRVNVDFRVLLRCSEEARRERLSAREAGGILVGRLAECAFRERVIALQDAFDFDLILETDGLRPPDVASRIQARIHG